MHVGLLSGSLHGAFVLGRTQSHGYWVGRLMEIVVGDMAKKRIKQNFYTVSAEKFERITKNDREAMSEEEKSYWQYKDFWYVTKRLPDNRLYAGWGWQHPTKLTPDDLPDNYILLTNHKKHGYIRTHGVVDIVYHPSPFHNHTFKDDFLYISYTKPLGEYVGGFASNSTIVNCDEYIFGNDIIDFIFAVEKNSPDVNVADIKRRMVEQYNAYCDEMNEWKHLPKHKKIEKLEDLL